MLYHTFEKLWGVKGLEDTRFIVYEDEKVKSDCNFYVSICGLQR